ncbi:MAG: PKD domain-containing protein [Mucispirillum sp.]|nr:PKD domain-containing protein [Mucispirillum sp.]
MKRVIMFIFLAFALSSCGDISLDSDGGGNNSHINSGSNSSNGNSGNTSDESGDDSSDGNSGDTSDGSGDDSSDENNGDTSDENEVVKFDCYAIDNLDVECCAIPLSSAVEINEYNWNFGDSSATHSGKYTGQVVTHRYRRSGEYNIKLDIKYLDSGIQKTLSYSKPVSVKQTLFPHIFAKGFGAEVNKMYYALHITGSSQINSATKTGLFSQKGNGCDGKYKEDFARDLYYQLSSGGAHLKFSESHKAVGVSDFYSNEYGFTDSDGLVFDMPFYFGMASWNIPVTNSNGKVSFVSFALEDRNSYCFSPDFDATVFVRCNNNMFNFQIPMNEYDAGRYKNVALFTVKFTGICDYTVEFDGFLDK